MISGPTVGILACYISKLPANYPKELYTFISSIWSKKQLKETPLRALKGGKCLKIFFCKVLNSYFGPKCIVPTVFTSDEGWLTDPQSRAESLVFIQSLALMKGVVPAVTILVTAAVTHIALTNTSCSTVLKGPGSSWRRKSRC